jgi:hypothetical protein
MLSPIDANTTIGCLIDFSRSSGPARGAPRPAASLLPTNRLLTIQRISSSLKQVVAAPPALELEVALALAVDLVVEVVVLVPKRVRRIQVLEVRDQVRAVERAGAEIAREQRDPRAAGEAARVAHRVVAVVAGPVRHRRAVDHERPGHVGTRRREHHHGPAALAVADERGLRAVGMALGDDAHELRFRVGDVGERLPGLRLGEEDHEVDRVAFAQRDADLRVVLEAPDARPVAGARVDDDERALRVVDLRAGRRHDAHQRVVAGTLVRARVREHLVAVVQQRRLAGILVRDPLVAALADRVPEQRAALARVDPVRGPVGPPLLRVRGRRPPPRTPDWPALQARAEVGSTHP